MVQTKADKCLSSASQFSPFNCCSSQFSPFNCCSSQFSPFNCCSSQFSPFSCCSSQFSPFSCCSSQFSPFSCCLSVNLQLGKGDQPKMCKSCLVRINGVPSDFLRVWILFYNPSGHSCFRFYCCFCFVCLICFML